MPLDLPELNEVLYSDKLTYGHWGREFESELSKFIGVELILTVNSYNTAFLILISTLGLNPGDEVIASPIGCLASYQPLAVKGLKIVWADVNPKTGTLCPDDVRAKISNKTKAIFHNHFCGYIGDIESINSIGKEFGIPVIDDAIEAFGSRYKNSLMGNLGTDVTIFSFQTVRLPNTIEGGAIVFKSKELYNKALLVRDYGIDRSNFRTHDGEINPESDIKVEGYAGLMSEFNSYIGSKQMGHLEGLLKIQRSNALIWCEELLGKKDFEPLIKSYSCEPNFWVFGILSHDKKQALNYFKEQGYSTSGVHINNNIYSIFGNKKTLNGVNEFNKKFIAVPSGWWFKKNK